MTQILIGIDHDTVRVYQAEAEKRGYASGQALISALLADWPAILAPAQPEAQPRERTTDDQMASLGNLLGLALARIAILEQAHPKGAITDAPDFPMGSAF